MSIDDMQTAMADLNIYLDDLKSRDVTNLKSELQFNIVPLLESLAKAVISDSEEQWGVITELIETADDIIHPELAGIIVGTLELGGVICRIIKENKLGLENDLATKKLQTAMRDYQRNAVIAIQRIAEVTIDLDEEEEDGTDGAYEDETKTEETSSEIYQEDGDGGDDGDDGDEFGNDGDEFGDEGLGGK